MAYQFRYSVSDAAKLSPRNDGSGCVDHQIYCESTLEGEDEWSIVPGRSSRTFIVPAQEMIDILALPSGIVKAYKDLLVNSFDNQAEPIIGWSEIEMTQMLDNNELSIQAHSDLIEFVQPFGFPLHFQLDL